MKINKNENILIVAYKGMVGSAVYRSLKRKGYKNISAIARDDLDLLNQSEVLLFFKKNSFDKVYICAAKVGGIYSNSQYPADFICQNIDIQSNIINACHQSNVNNIIFLGSSCIYPKEANQPIIEEALLTGPLEPTNQWYAIAKIAGIKMCESYNIQYGRNYRCIMPTNLYGPNDNYHEKNSHVIPSLIRKFYFANKNLKESVEIWGTGKPLREFLHVDDMADASIFISNVSKDNMNAVTKPDLSHINVGTGLDISIFELAELIKGVSNFNGDILCNPEKPDGTMRKVLDISKLVSLGWSPKISLIDGIKEAYDWFEANYPDVRGS